MREHSARLALQRGFTLMELMVASGVFTLLMLIAISILGNATAVWRRTSEKVEAFQGARLGFDLMTRNLAQATLNTYLDYDNPSTPRWYLRKSDLHFVCARSGESFPESADPEMPGTAGTGSALFFQAMLGHAAAEEHKALTNALNTCGYYVQFGSDPSIPKFHTAGSRYRYRLMQLLVPQENTLVFGGSTYNSFDWFRRFTDIADTDDSAQAAVTRPRAVAENVIALLIRPQDPADDSVFSTYEYNSRQKDPQVPQATTTNQLPPVIQVTMIAINEASALRFAQGSVEPQTISDALKEAEFTDTAELHNDIDKVTAALIRNRIQYRVFQSAIPILEAKWTKK